MHLLAALACLLAAHPADALSSYQPSRYSTRPTSPAAPTSTPSCSSGSNPALAPGSQEWSGWGGNVYNNRWASHNSQVDSSSIHSLAQYCKVEYPLGVSATPTLEGDIAYYPTWNGSFVALNYVTCQVQWQINVTQLIADFAPITAEQLAVTSAVARTSPVIDGNILYFGTLVHALLFAVDRKTGATLGSIQINSHPVAILTMSPTLYNGRIYIGASSQEELASSLIPGYVCCTFVGNMAALTFSRATHTFTTSWNVSMLPSPPGGWSGAAIWGSQPSIDPARSQLFIATGNVYSLPPAFALCQNQSAAITVVAEGLAQDPCLPANVLQESVVALDLSTGLINWATQLSPLDAYTTACNVSPRPANCPYTPGPDADFGMAPSFVAGSANTPYGKDTVVVGQKNGNLYALSAQGGRTFWATVTSPDGEGGGLIWGVAVDDDAVYFTAVNFNEVAWQLQPQNRTVNGSAFGAAALADGRLRWETAAPGNGLSLVPPSVVNDVVFAGVTGATIPEAYVGTSGRLVVLRKGSGGIVRDMELGANFHGGIAVQGRYVIFGTGYQTFAEGVGAFLVYKV